MFRFHQKKVLLYDDTFEHSIGQCFPTFHFYKSKEGRYLGIEFLTKDHLAKYPLSTIKILIQANEKGFSLQDFYDKNIKVGFIKKSDAEELVLEIADWYAKKTLR